MTFFAALLPLNGNASAPAAIEPVLFKREIVALYDGGQEGNADWTRIHRFAEMPLNHLGFILRFRDVRTQLPELKEMEQYVGVLTWFVGSVPNSDAYLAWASRVSRMNIRYVILGDLGVMFDPAKLPAINRLLELTGVKHAGENVAQTLGTRVLQKDESLIEFECHLDPVLPEYPIVQVSGSSTRVGLMLETPPDDGHRKTVLVSIGDNGAYAAANYEFCDQGPPLYQGRWLINPFTFFAAAFGLNDQPIPDTTTESGNRLYLSVLEQQGWSRPSRIEEFQDRALTAGEVVVRELTEPFNQLPTTVDVQNDKGERLGRSARQAHMILERLLAEHNIDRLRSALRASRSRVDTEYPSVSNLAPLISASPGHVVYEPLSAESDYSGGYPVSESGFSALKETLANTEWPRRLKPFNLNYGAYAGEYAGLLRSIKDLLRDASVAELTPVSANRYLAIIEGFFSARISHVGSSWQISNRGELQTIRFDGTSGRRVDFRSSVGVIGQRRRGSTLYVALDQAIEPAVIALGPSTPLDSASSRFVLIESRWRVHHLVKDECAMSFEAQGYGAGTFSWSDVTSGAYAISIDQGGKEMWQQSAEADGAGRMEFVLPALASDGVVVRIRCADTARSAD